MAVEDLWNHQMSNPSVLSSMIANHSNQKESSKCSDSSNQQQMNQKQLIDRNLNNQGHISEKQKGQGANPSDCFEIKEARYEEEIESPKQRAENKLARTPGIQLTATPNTVNKIVDRNSPTLKTPTLDVDEIPNRLTYQGSEDNPKDSRRECKSVDNPRSGPALRKQTGDSKDHKARTDTTQAMYRKINMDIFAVTAGKKPADKSKSSSSLSLQKKQVSSSGFATSKNVGSKKLLYSSHTHKPELSNQTPTNLTEE